MAIEETRIYLDHAATTPIREEVRLAMEPYLGRSFGNPSSLHLEGREVREALEASRQALRSCLRAREFQLIFTAGGTEADNAAIMGVLLAHLKKKGAGSRGGHVVASAVEHAAIMGALELVRFWGGTHTLVPVDAAGRVDPDDVLAAIQEDTVMVSLMAANNEVGTLQPIVETGTLLREKGIPFHTDAVQLLGKLPLKLADLPVDLLSCSAHKIYGTKGTGGLLVRKELPFEGFLRGGSQENGLRGGTEGVAGVVGFSRAVELAVEEVSMESSRLENLRQRLRKGIEEEISGVRFNTPDSETSPHILNVTFDRLEGESLLLLLDRLGVAVSTGSACNVGAMKPSHVLEAMGRSAREIRGSLRFSVGRSTTEEKIDEAVNRIHQAVNKLRSIAP